MRTRSGAVRQHQPDKVSGDRQPAPPGLPADGRPFAVRRRNRQAHPANQRPAAPGCPVPVLRHGNPWMAAIRRPVSQNAHERHKGPETPEQFRQLLRRQRRSPVAGSVGKAPRRERGARPSCRPPPRAPGSRPAVQGCNTRRGDASGLSSCHSPSRCRTRLAAGAPCVAPPCPELMPFLRCARSSDRPGCHEVQPPATAGAIIAPYERHKARHMKSTRACRQADRLAP